MKTQLFITALIICSLTFSAKSQIVSKWSDPVAFTDSASYNSNPFLVKGTTAIFYEKKTEPASPSAIYFINLNNNCGETEVLSGDSVIYRNPQGVNLYDTIKYFLYESNEAGNFDIYAMKYDLDCNFWDPVRLTFSQEDESSLNIYDYGMGITFLRGNNVVYANVYITDSDSIYLSNIQVIDTTQSLNPAVTDYELYWQRFAAGEYHIYKSVMENNMWSLPIPFFTEGNNENLKLAKQDSEFLTAIPFWENNGNYLYNNSFDNIDTLDIYPSVDTVYQLCPFAFLIGSKNYYKLGVSFTTGTGDDRFIYEYDDWSFSDTLSESGIRSSNSALFCGPVHPNGWSDYLEWYCIWESEINDRTVLYYSERDVELVGEIDENHTGRLANVYPNPFTDEIRIEIKNPGDETFIDILDLTGKIVFQKTTKNQSYLIWHPENDIPYGVYILKIRQGDKIEIRKVVYTDN